MADRTVYEESDLFTLVHLQEWDEDTQSWIADVNAAKVDIEVFNPNDVSIGVKTLVDGVENVGAVTLEDGEEYGRYRALFFFADPGIYKQVAKCEGSAGAKLSMRDDIPIERL